MSRKKKVRTLLKAQARADKATHRAWKARAKLSRTEFDRVVPGLQGAMVKGARVDHFEAFLARRAAGGDASARELLAKRGADRDPAYRRYLERVAKQAQSGEVRSGAAAELARLDGDGPAAPPANWRWTAW